MTLKLRTRDNETVDTELQDAESYDLDSYAKRVILVDSSGTVIKSTRTRENLAGSAGSGSNGDTNRVFTLTTSANSINIVEVYLDGLLLNEVSQYNVDDSLKTVTFLVNVFDTQNVSIFFNQ